MMKIFRRWSGGLVAAMLLAGGGRGEAQSVFFSAAASTNVVANGGTVSYSLTLTNQGNPFNFYLTNAFSTRVALVAQTNNFGGNGYRDASGSNVVFVMSQLTPGFGAQINFTIQPATSGFLTNTINVWSPDFALTNLAGTNLVVQFLTATADLAVGIFPTNQQVFTGDWGAYDVAVANFGPDAAANVMLTNTLPAGLVFKGASQAATQSGSNQIFNLGTLAGGTQTDVRIFFQATNGGALPLSATVGAANIIDPNPTNNAVSVNLLVTAYLPGTLVATALAAPATNPQNGLAEQLVQVSNVGTNTAPAVRLVVTGLTNRMLFNAVGTNNDNPFVTHSVPLAPGHSVNLLLQFSPRGTFALAGDQLQPFAVVPLNLTPPAVHLTSTNVNLSRIVRLAGGNMLLELPATPGQSYTVVYSDNVSFSNALVAPPAVTAAANRLQWIDYGPPTTASAPTNAARRFYRVFQNP